jgi:glycosyltransferase involved in cell wall biosynthesis
MRLLVLCPYPEGVAPSQRLKYEQYFDFLAANNWEVTVRPFISPELWRIMYEHDRLALKVWYTLAGYVYRISLLRSISSYDVVYIHLWATPFGMPLYEWIIRRLSKKLIYDIDDLIYLKRIKSRASGIVSIIKGRKKPLFLMRNADHVITCTPYLDGFARQFNLRTTDISSTVNTEIYLPANRYYGGDKLVLGWSGSHSTSRYLHLLKDVLLQLSKDYDFSLLVMGDPRFSLPGLDIEIVGWSAATEVPTLARMDIGLYPLPADDHWVLGKSGLKAIQYMAMGLPTIATAIGANFRVIEHGVSGFLVTNEEEWYECLQKLICDPATRMRIGQEGRKRVLERFSVYANRNTYLGILNGLVDSR